MLNTQGPRLGIPVLQNEETQLRALEEEARIELSEFIMKLHKLVRVHEYKKAFALIESFQKENSHSLDANLFERLSQWDDKRLAVKLGAGFAERLLKEGDTQRALKVFRESYEMNPRKFKLTSGSRALEFLEAARDAPSRIKVYEYLQRFDEDFPNHPRALDVLMQVAALAANEYDDKTTAIVFLKKAADLKPEIVKTPEYQQLQHELVI